MGGVPEEWRAEYAQVYCCRGKHSDSWLMATVHGLIGALHVHVHVH